jgi:hypothetical protein
MRHKGTVNGLVARNYVQRVTIEISNEGDNENSEQKESIHFMVQIVAKS